MSSPSPMVAVLDALNAFKVPDNFGYPELDWKGAFRMPLPKQTLNQMDFVLRPSECLVTDGEDGNCVEIQHHDGLIGDRSGPVGNAYANAIMDQIDFMNRMQAVYAPNLSPPVRTCIATKVKTHNLTRILQLWGTAQEAFAAAVSDCYEHGYFPDNAEHKLVITGGVFIHPGVGLTTGENPQKLSDEELAKSNHRLWCLCYATTVGMLFDGITGGLTPEERIARRKDPAVKHPYRGFEFAKAS